jgi:choline dehydrogenase-like flavoprotein
MNETFDVIIVGTGPAGVSAAFPLVKRGLRVLMIDGDLGEIPNLLADHYLDARKTDDDQWRWMIGSDFHAMKTRALSSPKFRVAAFANVFADFSKENRIETHNFTAVGSLAAGGLSNAWGCGVARFDDRDLADFPFLPDELTPSYERVVRRIGVSGRSDDDLVGYYGLDNWTQRPIALDKMHERIFARYSARSTTMKKIQIRMGRSRMAALAEDISDRRGCDLRSNCLWGCSRKALYNARFDLDLLVRKPNLQRRTGVVAERLAKNSDAWIVHCRDRKSGAALEARGHIILLAAGCIASARFVLGHLDLFCRPVPFFSNPTAGFLVWFPHAMGSTPENGFGSSQLSFALSSDNSDVSAFGSFFSTNGLPVSEFLKFVPLAKRYGIDFLKYFLPSCLVGNVFFPGSLSDHELMLAKDRTLHVTGRFSDDLDEAFSQVKRKLTRALRALGGILPPGGFVLGAPGSDVHYAGALPMKATPRIGESNSRGEIAGMPGVFAVDGASLPSLPAKSHTLTIMANADRIGTGIAQRWHN